MILLIPGGVVGDGGAELDVHDDTPEGEMNTTHPEHPANGKRQRTVVPRHFMTPPKSTIYAPIDGVVLTRAVNPGQTVASSMQAPVLFVLAADLSRMELKAAVDEQSRNRTVLFLFGHEDVRIER